jgi:hypothetical protein
VKHIVTATATATTLCLGGISLGAILNNYDLARWCAGAAVFIAWPAMLVSMGVDLWWRRRK